ncbi:MAG: SDR family oxidoreductase [Pseudomonadota bacterium]
MANTALITGASSGIGRELALYHASKGGDVVITARRKPELETLKAEIEKDKGVKVHVFAIDLASKGGPEKLYNAVKKAGLQVDILINNAGFGGRGVHVERDLDQEMAMIDLNVKSLVELTHRFAADMVNQGGGKILNVGSTAGFMPGPLQAIYFATKAFVNSFSQAIDQELRDKGVTCTVLAPGYVETEFAQVADLEGTLLVSAKGAKAKDVARVGYNGMRAKQLFVINDALLNVMVNWIVPLLPRRLVLKMIARSQRK